MTTPIRRKAKKRTQRNKRAALLEAIERDQLHTETLPSWTQNPTRIACLAQITHLSKELDTVLEEFLWINYIVKGLVQRVQSGKKRFEETGDTASRDSLMDFARSLVEQWRRRFVEGQARVDATAEMVRVLEPLWEEVDVGRKGREGLEAMADLVTQYVAVLEPVCLGLAQFFEEGTEGFCGIK